MKTMMNDNNVTKRLSFVERLAKYVEDNAVYFANLHCVCSEIFTKDFNFTRKKLDGNGGEQDAERKQEKKNNLKKNRGMKR